MLTSLHQGGVRTPPCLHFIFFLYNANGQVIYKINVFIFLRAFPVPNIHMYATIIYGSFSSAIFLGYVRERLATGDIDIDRAPFPADQPTARPARQQLRHRQHHPSPLRLVRRRTRPQDPLGVQWRAHPRHLGGYLRGAAFRHRGVLVCRRGRFSRLHGQRHRRR